MTWLPGYQRILIPGALGKTHLSRVNKLLWHTTEGSTVEGAVAEYLRRRVPPHLTVDPARGRLTQHVPLDRAAYALHSVDQTGVIQVEIVGFARQTRNWSDGWLRWLGENVAAPIFEHCQAIDRHVSRVTHDELTNTNPPLASPHSPIRLTRQAWDRFSGQLGHQHAPAPNNHWDPGALNLVAIAAYARAVLTPPPPPDLEDADMDIWNYVNDAYAEAGWVPGSDGRGRRYWTREALSKASGAERAEVLRQMEQLLGLAV
jgi:hypothetical protein